MSWVSLLTSLTSSLFIGLAPPAGADGPLSPAEALRSIRLEPGMRAELVAAEPLVASPVAFAFDERGRLFVAENRGYPTGPGEGGPPVGRIAMLEDTDGDGRMDRRAEFADGLTYPNGLMPWKGGLIVTCAPDVLHLKDTDGDGRADTRTVLFTGFATTGSTQLRVSHPTLSIDNWVYLTSGLSGGKVTRPASPNRPAVELKRTDFRFRPDGDVWEAADGGAQFGISFDDFGRRFICYNRVQVQHVVIDSRTLRRNRNLTFAETVQNCPADMVAEPLKGHGASARLYPVSSNITTADSHAGTFTAACAVFVWRGTGLPDRYRGGVLSCDPTGNLVHFDRLEPDGATFRARRASDGVEFLASTDNWFRPVFLASGPDGALYVADMYRKTIEHPDYLPVEVRKHTDFVSGKDMGRIWRVVREDGPPVSARGLSLANATTAELGQALRSADGWWRDTAHRLLLERRPPDAAPVLEALLGGSANAATVVHAARLLEALGALKEGHVQSLLKRSDARLRELGASLAGARLRSDPRWLPRLLPLADDADARVRFAAAIALGEAERAEGDDAVAAALARVARRDATDRWTRAAVLSGLTGRERAFLVALRGLFGQDVGDTEADLLIELGRLAVASLGRDEWPGLVRDALADQRATKGLFSAALLTGMAEAARGRLAGQGNAASPLSSLLGDRPDPTLMAKIDDLLETMKRATRDERGPRRHAIGLLACTEFDKAAPTLVALLQRDQPETVQAAAVRALGRFADQRVAVELLAPERFASYTPALREEALAAVFAQTSQLDGLLTALEEGRLPLVAIDALRRRQLTQARDPGLRERAAKLFGAVAGDRAQVYESFKDVIKLPSDSGKGRAVFLRECASCHRLDREGSAVGPDLFGIRNQPKESILLHVLVPDQEITQGFTAYTIATKDGRVFTGLIVSESPAGVTLRLPQGKEEVVARGDIDEVQASPQSLMPQGLEKTIGRQEMADLLAYLKGERAP